MEQLKPVAELIAMLDVATQEEGRTIFDHTPEEFGLHVMENWQEIRAALAAPPADHVAALVEALEKANNRIKRMQSAVASHFTNPTSTDHTLANVLIYLLDGPEQREMQRATRAALAQWKDKSHAE